MPAGTMSPRTKLDTADVLERILAHAVWLHPDAGDLAGLLAYARVIPPSHAPRVHRAILRRCPLLSPEVASARGSVHVLDAWRDYGMFDPATAPVATAVAAAAEARHLAVIEWWRDSGASLEEAAAHRPDQVAVALGLGRPVYEDEGAGFRRWIGFTPPTEPDAGIYAALDGIAAGSQTELVLDHERVSLVGIRALSAALASPHQRLTSLTILGCTLDLPRLRALRLPSTLTTLELQQCWFPVSRCPPDALDGWAWPPRLTALHLDGNPLSPDLVTLLFATLPATLRRLSLSDCELDDQALNVLAPLLPRGVTDLSLARNDVRCMGLGAACAHLPPALTRLDLAGNVIGTTPSASAVHWAFPAGLRELVLDDTVLDQHGTQSLTDSLPRSLEVLCIRNAHIVSGEVESLAARIPPRLRVLDFGSNRVTEHGIAAVVAALPDTLEELDLDDCRLNARLMQAEIAPRLPRGLRRLELSCTDLGDAGVQALAAHVPPKLETLCLDEVDVGDDGVTELARHLPWTLVALGLSRNPRVTDKGARAVAGNWPPRLVELDLAGTSVGCDGVRAIQAAADAAVAQWGEE
ncbi:hypothetical protein H9P43_008497 [Blastocladiella emersonii ATCC 22665]|nr:hypothetical protein H9P43_008497 [Blastocladiella emersonii ATCC 22665]